jgi:hypothetical protein
VPISDAASANLKELVYLLPACFNQVTAMPVEGGGAPQALPTPPAQPAPVANNANMAVDGDGASTRATEAATRLAEAKQRQASAEAVTAAAEAGVTAAAQDDEAERIAAAGKAEGEYTTVTGRKPVKKG